MNVVLSVGSDTDEHLFRIATPSQVSTWNLTESVLTLIECGLWRTKLTKNIYIC